MSPAADRSRPLSAFDIRFHPHGEPVRAMTETSAIGPRRHRGCLPMRKALPEQMFSNPENSRLTSLRSWVLDHQVTEIDMQERQFWNFAALQPVAEKPWTTFMGRLI